MSKKYVSQCLSNNNMGLNKYVEDGNITSREFLEYFSGAELFPKNWVKALSDGTEAQIILYLSKYMDKASTASTKYKKYDAVYTLIEDSKISLDSFYYFYFNRDILYTAYERVYTDVDTFIYNFNNKIFKIDDLSIKTQPLILSKLQELVLSLLDKQKMTLEEYYTYFNFKNFVDKYGRIDSTKRRDFRLLVESGMVLLGDMSKIKIRLWDREILTTPANYLDEARFESIGHNFDWFTFSKQEDVAEKVMLKCYERLDLFKVLQNNQVVSIDFLLKYGKDFRHKNGEVYVEDLYKNLPKGKSIRWTVEELSKMIEAGIINIREEVPTKELLEQFGEKVYRLNYKQKLEFRLPYGNYTKEELEQVLLNYIASK